MASPCSVLMLGDSDAFAASLRTLINNPQFSDVTFLVGREQKEVFAHRCLLSSRCQAFHAMLSQPQKAPQAPLILSHVQPEVFLAVLEYLYSNSVTLNNLIALEVLTSSVEYGLDDLSRLCAEFIKNTLNVEQACEAFQSVREPLSRGDLSWQPLNVTSCIISCKFPFWQTASDDTHPT
ncbi:BTB/POZ domain-containing protein 19 [Varanus komodoensis]|nr:BTB/POZ domain-containing protein 19 [Varanus komodoensis]